MFGGTREGDSPLESARERRLPELPPEAVRDQLDKILASQGFLRSERLSAFLRFLVEQTLQGEAAKLKEYTLGVEIYGRKPSYDPQSDSIVRVEASRLRQKLAEYYRTEGQDDRLVIDLPPRTYVPAFRQRELPTPQPPASARGRFRSWIGSRAAWRLTPLTVLTLVVAGVAVFWVAFASSSRLRGFFAAKPQRSSGPASIVVLPFTDLSEKKDQEYFADGLTEEIINALARLPGVRVISRTSSFKFKGQADDVRKIGAQLNAEMVLEGSLRRQGDRLRIIAQLINVSDGYHVWSQAYERAVRDAFAIQEEVARGIASALRLELAGSRSNQSAQSFTPSEESHNLYLKGLYFSRQWSEEGLSKAIDQFEQAVRTEPRFAKAHAELSELYCVLAIHAGLPPREVMPKAKAAAEKALALDPLLPEAHSSLGLVKGIYEWDWAAAGKELRRAHELDPGDTGVHEAYVMGYLAPTGRLDEALVQIREAQALDPLSPRITSLAGIVYYYRRQHDQAIDQFRKALELDPQFYSASLALGAAYEQKGMFAEALQAIQVGRPAWASGVARSLLGYTYGLMGRTSEARALCDELTKLSGERYVSAGHIALIHLALGEKDAALEWLEKAYEQRSATLALLKINPRWDSLRSDPRFVALLKKIGLA